MIFWLAVSESTGSEVYLFDYECCDEDFIIQYWRSAGYRIPYIVRPKRG